MRAANVVEPGTAEYDLAVAQLRGERRHKYNAEPFTDADGVRWDSQAEFKRFGELVMLERAGYISGLRRQVRFELQPAFFDGRGRRQRAINYIADFVYFEDDRIIAEDVKGGKATETAHFRDKAKMFRRVYPHIVLRLTGRNRPTVAERE
jgi:hypothetical protein